VLELHLEEREFLSFVSQKTLEVLNLITEHIETCIVVFVLGYFLLVGFDQLVSQSVPVELWVDESLLY
jgi:hypothetical protein